MAHDGSEYLDSLTEGSSTPFDYGYDERGNLRTRVVAAASPSHTTYHVNDKDQITGIDVGNGSSVTQSYAVSYDARYNVQSDGKCSYVYDLEDLPTSVTCGTTTTPVQRDGFGRPARVVASGGQGRRFPTRCQPAKHPQTKWPRSPGRQRLRPIDQHFHPIPRVPLAEKVQGDERAIQNVPKKT